jgi:hypothetical protein
VKEHRTCCGLRGGSAVVRSFRFAGTLTTMQLAASLVRATLALGAAAQTAARQLEAESKKKGKVTGPKGVLAGRCELQLAQQPPRWACKAELGDLSIVGAKVADRVLLVACFMAPLAYVVMQTCNGHLA